MARKAETHGERTGRLLAAADPRDLNAAQQNAAQAHRNAEQSKACQAQLAKDSR